MNIHVEKLSGKQLVALMCGKSPRCKSSGPIPSIASVAAALKQLQTDKIQRVLCASSAFSVDNKNKVGIREYFLAFYGENYR